MAAASELLQLMLWVLFLKGEAVAQAAGDAGKTPAPAREGPAKVGRRASHVRFSTPAAPTYVPKAMPSQTKGVNSCNAGMLRIIICQGGCVVHRQAAVSASRPPYTAMSLYMSRCQTLSLAQ